MTSTSGPTSVRWGILGTGTAARDFTEGLRAAPGAQARAVASRSAARAEAFARALGVERGVEGRDALLADPDVDVVYVATTADRHADDARACLEAGKAVLCEKPFATDAAGARAVVSVARAQGLFCMEAMWMRFIPLVRRARALVRSGEIGDLRLVRADFGLPTPAAPGSRYFDPERGGGALLERGVYGVSLAHWLLGPPADVTGRAAIGETGVDEQNAAILRYDGGALAVLTSSLRTRASNEALLVGSRGSLRLHEPFFRPERIAIARGAAPPPEPDALAPRPGARARLARIRLLRGARLRLARLRPAGGGREIVEALAGNGYQHEALEVARCLREGLLESPEMTWDDTIAVMETLDALRARFAPGRDAERTT